MRKFKEHDTVISISEIPNVPIGSPGTIVHVYPEEKAFEVEFFKDEVTITVETVLPNQIIHR